MSTIDTEAHMPVPAAFPSDPSTLADMLEAGINAAWQGAGIDVPAIRDATRALIRLRELDRLAQAVRLILTMHDHPEAAIPGYSVHLDPKAEAQLRVALGQRRATVPNKAVCMADSPDNPRLRSVVRGKDSPVCEAHGRALFMLGARLHGAAPEVRAAWGTCVICAEEATPVPAGWDETATGATD